MVRESHGVLGVMGDDYEGMMMCFAFRSLSWRKEFAK